MSGGVCVDWVSDNFAWWCEVVKAIILIISIIIPLIIILIIIINNNNIIVIIISISIISIMLRWSGQDRTIGILWHVQA